MSMEKMILTWLGLMVLFMIVEAFTVGFTSIWFAGGAFAALLAALLKCSLTVQVVIFFAVSLLLIVFTRPFAKKFVNSRHTRTNYEELIGKVVKVTETVDNYAQTGVAVANGLEWTARSGTDEEKIEAGTLAEVIDVSGVKLILKQFKEDM